MDLDRASLKKKTDEMLEALANPAFLEQIEAMQQLPLEQRMEEAAKRLTPAALKRAGIDLPEGGRLSTRYFEEDFSVDMTEEEARVSVTPQFSETQPDSLVRLRTEHPDLFRPLSRKPTKDIPEPDAWSICLCGGASAGLGICLGAGGGP